MGIWRVEMLGTFQLRGRDAIVSRFRTKRVAILLAYLSLHRNRSFSRDALAELLWPEGDPQVTRRNLRQALTSLRHVIEPPPMKMGSILTTSQAGLKLNAEEVTTDVAEFENLVARAQRESDSLELLKQAVAAYKGDFLPGFEGAWVQAERLRLEDLYVAALGQLTEASIAQDQPVEAISALRSTLARDSLREDAHKKLIRQYLAMNRPQAALRQFEELKQLLETELGLEPDDESLELAEQARRALSAGAEKAIAAIPDALKPQAQAGDSEAVLPVLITRLFGRLVEIEGVMIHFEEHRSHLLTILGPAGTGKTRLSVEVGRRLSKRGWRVFFVPLAEIDQPSQIFDRILDTLHVGRRDGGDPMPALREVLDRPNTLLILDNFEHLMEEGAAYVKRLIDQVSQVYVLVSSRQSLNLEPEQEFPLEPLAIPALGEDQAEITPGEVADLAAYPSVGLFVDRCQAVRPDAQITHRNARDMAAICARLEGSPLAIELAAGLSNVFTPSQMLAQLEKRLLILESRKRDAEPRHRSLRAAIDYSFEFLNPDLQRFFALLSVFRGGFTAESADEICGETPGGISRMQDLLERSLIRRVEGASEPRFKMLEVFREYGEETLTPGELESLRRRHADYYLRICQPDASGNLAEERSRLHRLIEADYENVLAALEFLIQDGRIVDAVRLLTSLCMVWDIRGTRRVEQQFIHRVSRHPDIEQIPASERIVLLRLLATTYLRDSEYKLAFQACEQALKVAEHAGDKGLMAACYFGMALCAGHLGDTQHCLVLCEKVLENAPESEGVLLERTYVNIGSAKRDLGELHEAELAFEKARDISAGFRDGHPDPLILARLAGVLLDLQRGDEALALLRETQRRSIETHNEISHATALVEIARYHRLFQQFEAGIAASLEALGKAKELGITALTLDSVRGHALLVAEAGELELGATLMAATSSLEPRERPADRLEREKIGSKVRASLGDKAFEKAWSHGVGLGLREATRLILASRQGC